jgi:hypothetical protein
MHDRNVRQSGIDLCLTSPDARIRLNRLYPASCHDGPLVQSWIGCMCVHCVELTERDPARSVWVGGEADPWRISGKQYPFKTMKTR